MLWYDSSENKLGSLANVYRVVANALEEPANDCELHGNLNIHFATSMTFKNFLDELTMQSVQERVHIVDGCSLWRIAQLEGIHCRDKQLLCLFSHFGDQASQHRINVMTINSSRTFADVDCQVG